MAPVRVHPQLLAHVHNVLVGIGRAVEILGNRLPCALGVDHILGVGFQRADDCRFLVVGNGVGFGLLHVHARFFIVNHRHFRAGLVLDGNGGPHHQAGDALNVGLVTGGADGQELRGGGGGGLDGERFVQLHAVDIGLVAVYLLNQVSLGPVKVQCHRTQLPVGDVRHLFRMVFQGERGDALVIHLDVVLFITGKTGRGLYIGQLAFAHLLGHVGRKGILALVGGILNTRHGVEAAPIRVVKELVEHFFALGIGLGGFVVFEPPFQVVKTQERSQTENGDKQEIQGVENHAANPGSFLFRGLLDSCGGGSSGLLGHGTGPCLLGPGLGHLLPGSVGGTAVGFVGPLLLLLDFRGEAPLGSGTVFCFKFTLIHVLPPPY